MKISNSIRRVYDEQLEKNNRLKMEIDKRIIGIKKERWHYESRVKTPLSFAMKLETGRVKNPNCLEDFFACTLVLANTNELKEAKSIISREFDVAYRRPASDSVTHKKSDSFPFDDLRLYCRLKINETMPPSDLNVLVFEIQLKTFLQHAWSIATHDLIYKGSNSAWSMERIAYQIKAMLEHAEISIQQATDLANCSSLAKEDKPAKSMTATIKIIKDNWTEDQLPDDLRRLAQNFLDIMQAMKLTAADLKVLLNEQREERGGRHPVNLSPFGTVVQYLFDGRRDSFIKFLEGPESKARVLISPEIEMPAELQRDKIINAVFLQQKNGIRINYSALKAQSGVAELRTI